MDDPRIASATVADDMLSLFLEDGRIVSVPIAFYWRLADATARQLQRFEILPNRRGLHWPDLDEDISIRGVLDGAPARRPGQRASMKVEDAARYMGIAARTLRRTLSRMEEEGFRVGETRGSYRVLSEEDLGQVTRWRQEHPRGRPIRRDPAQGEQR